MSCPSRVVFLLFLLLSPARATRMKLDTDDIEYLKKFDPEIGMWLSCSANCAINDHCASIVLDFDEDSNDFFCISEDIQDGMPKTNNQAFTILALEKSPQTKQITACLDNCMADDGCFSVNIVAEPDGTVGCRQNEFGHFIGTKVDDTCGGAPMTQPATRPETTLIETSSQNPTSAAVIETSSSVEEPKNSVDSDYGTTSSAGNTVELSTQADPIISPSTLSPTKSMSISSTEIRDERESTAVETPSTSNAVTSEMSDILPSTESGSDAVSTSSVPTPTPSDGLIEVTTASTVPVTTSTLHTSTEVSSTTLTSTAQDSSNTSVDNVSTTVSTIPTQNSNSQGTASSTAEWEATTKDLASTELPSTTKSDEWSTSTEATPTESESSSTSLGHPSSAGSSTSSDRTTTFPTTISPSSQGSSTTETSSETTFGSSPSTISSTSDGASTAPVVTSSAGSSTISVPDTTSHSHSTVTDELPTTTETTTTVVATTTSSVPTTTTTSQGPPSTTAPIEDSTVASVHSSSVATTRPVEESTAPSSVLSSSATTTTALPQKVGYIMVIKPAMYAPRQISNTLWETNIPAEWTSATMLNMGVNPKCSLTIREVGGTDRTFAGGQTYVNIAIRGLISTSGRCD